MKKMIMTFVLLLSTLFLVRLFAQPKPGIKAGWNSATMPAMPGTSRSGIHAGFFVVNRINQHWRIQPELLYSGEGVHYVPDETERTILLHYVQLPVMIQFSPGKTIYLETGPQFGVLAAALNKAGGSDKVNVKRSYGNTAFAWNAGIGYASRHLLGFSARYSMGLTDITLYDGRGVKSRVWQLGISLRLK